MNEVYRSLSLPWRHPPPGTGCKSGSGMAGKAQTARQCDGSEGGLAAAGRWIGAFLALMGLVRATGADLAWRIAGAR